MAITNGMLTGKTYERDVGIISILNCESEDCGGHSLAIGDPAGVSTPYRILVKNFEGNSSGNDAAVRYADARLYVRAANVRVVGCAWGGVQTDGGITGGAYIGGQNVELINTRFIETTYCVTVQTTDTTSRAITIDGVITFPSILGNQANAIILPAAGDARGVRIWAQTETASPGFTNFLSGTALGLEVYYNLAKTLTGTTTFEGVTVFQGNTSFTGEAAIESVITPSDSFTVIAAGVLNVSESFVQVTGEGGVADSIDTITYNGSTPPDGFELTITSGSSSQDITINNNTGNVLCGSNRVLGSSADSIVLLYKAAVSSFIQKSFSINV